ncbi:peptidase, M23 family, partial [Vibrio harveyi]
IKKKSIISTTTLKRRLNLTSGMPVFHLG